MTVPDPDTVNGAYCDCCERWDVDTRCTSEGDWICPACYADLTANLEAMQASLSSSRVEGEQR